jgi:abhydrolase domain-containing protein 6
LIWLLALVLAPPVALLIADYLTPGAAARALLRLRRRMAGLADRSVTLPDGLRMVYSEGGSGEPLVLLHGLGADRATFETVAKLLAPHNRLIIPDLPGFGESGQPADQDYGIDAQVERVDRFVGALGLESFHLGGNSMGGWIAAAYAARHPDKVKSLWLLAAAGTEDMLHTEAVAVRRDQGRYLLLARNRDEFDGVMRRIFHRPPFLPFCFRWLGTRRAAAYFPLHAKIFDQLLDNGHDYKLEPLLPQVTAPTLLAWGEHDSVVPLSVMRTFHRLLPRSTIALMDGIGHVPQMEDPRRSAADYLRFRYSISPAAD